jgi:hypothetical protein
MEANECAGLRLCSLQGAFCCWEGLLVLQGSLVLLLGRFCQRQAESPPTGGEALRQHDCVGAREAARCGLAATFDAAAAAAKEEVEL